MQAHSRNTSKRTITIPTERFCPAYFQFIHPDISTHTMCCARYYQLQGFRATAGNPGSWRKQSCVVSYVYASQISEQPGQRQIDHLVTGIFDAAAERHDECSTRLDPATE